MKGPQFLPLFTPLTAKVFHLFSRCFSQPENRVPPLLPNPKPLASLDNLSNEHLMEAGRRLLPPNSTLFAGDELNVLGSGPIGVGGYADIWEAALGDRSVILKSYRLYETGDIKHTSRVRDARFLSSGITHILVQRYRREILVCSKLSHPNVVLFVGVASTPSHPLSLALDTTGHHGLGEYLDENPQTDKLELVRHLRCSV